MKFLGWGRKRAVAEPATATGGGTTRAQGNAAEDRALAHLKSAGLQLLERNYRTPGRGGGEIDLVMRDRDGTTVFVEVRSRASQAFGGAGGSIGAVKQQRIVLAARHYLMRLASPPPCRFDVVLVQEQQVQWLKAAFDAG
ncbi:MAG: YraN family protein [Pseudomonadota bacterium]